MGRPDIDIERQGAWQIVLERDGFRWWWSIYNSAYGYIGAYAWSRRAALRARRRAIIEFYVEP